MKKLILLFSILVVPSPAVFAQNPTEPPLITVTGQAEVRVAPDEVLFTLEAESVDKDMLLANKKTDEVVKQVLSIARKSNVKPEDVQTSHISVEPKYNTDDLDDETRRKTKREMIGYEVSKTVVIRLRDISRFDELLADVLKAGITRLSNLEFRDSQIRQHRDQARVMAIKAAQEKANLLAREIGQSIGPAYSISEYAGDASRSSFAQNTTTVISGDLSDNDSATAPGSISVRAQVTVRFRLL